MHSSNANIFSSLFRIIKNRRSGAESTKGKRERIGRMVQMHANNRAEIDEVRAGDIAAVIGPRM